MPLQQQTAAIGTNVAMAAWRGTTSRHNATRLRKTTKTTWIARQVTTDTHTHQHTRNDAAVLPSRAYFHVSGVCLYVWERAVECVCFMHSALRCICVYVCVCVRVCYVYARFRERVCVCRRLHPLFVCASRVCAGTNAQGGHTVWTHVGEARNKHNTCAYTDCGFRWICVGIPR